MKSLLEVLYPFLVMAELVPSFSVRISIWSIDEEVRPGRGRLTAFFSFWKMDFPNAEVRVPAIEDEATSVMPWFWRSCQLKSLAPWAPFFSEPRPCAPSTNADATEGMARAPVRMPARAERRETAPSSEADITTPELHTACRRSPVSSSGASYIRVIYRGCTSLLREACAGTARGHAHCRSMFAASWIHFAASWIHAPETSAAGASAGSLQAHSVQPPAWQTQDTEPCTSAR
ncbi:hypothetical protein T484DRAFT_1929673 [Baffinella frigidus]|nr:hypothetical protein T484DRAFT_1929673 [Cryptophyta sp. CCMP2293]